MPLISPCIEPGCSKLCIGLFCIDHDSGPRADLPRGRPWPPARRAVVATTASASPLSSTAPGAYHPVVPAA
jgi:hypothetical protein